MGRGSMILSLLAVFVLVPVHAFAECTYSLGDDGVTVHWRAFKLASKAPVNGSFGATSLEGPRTANSWPALAKGLSMKIRGKSVDSGNPARDVTLATFFFGFVKEDGDIKGRVTRVEGDDRRGTVEIAVTLNGQTREIPFAYTIAEDGTVNAKASIDMLAFGMQEAHDQINQACRVQHTGEDGVSKTWTDVDLELRGKLETSCS